MAKARANPNSMLYWLARVCREKRKLTDRKQVHIAARLSVNQSTIDHFEWVDAWPRSADATVGAYAAELGVEPVELWTEAVRRWHAYRAGEAGEAISEAAAAAESQPRSASDGAAASKRRTRRRA